MLRDQLRSTPSIHKNLLLSTPVEEPIAVQNYQIVLNLFTIFQQVYTDVNKAGLNSFLFPDICRCFRPRPASILCLPLPSMV